MCHDSIGACSYNLEWLWGNQGLSLSITAKQQGRRWYRRWKKEMERIAGNWKVAGWIPSSNKRVWSCCELVSVCFTKPHTAPGMLHCRQKNYNDWMKRDVFRGRTKWPFTKPSPDSNHNSVGQTCQESDFTTSPQYLWTCNKGNTGWSHFRSPRPKTQWKNYKK